MNINFERILRSELSFGIKRQTPIEEMKRHLSVKYRFLYHYLLQLKSVARCRNSINNERNICGVCDVSRIRSTYLEEAWYIICAFYLLELKKTVHFPFHLWNTLFTIEMVINRKTFILEPTYTDEYLHTHSHEYAQKCGYQFYSPSGHLTLEV